MKPHKCPVCDGKGKMPMGFYREGMAEECRSCEGRGLVWPPQPEPEQPFIEAIGKPVRIREVEIIRVWPDWTYRPYGYLEDYKHTYITRIGTGTQPWGEG